MVHTHSIYNSSYFLSLAYEFFLGSSGIFSCVNLYLQAEVQFLGKLSHPNLVKLLGYGWDDNELFIVYEFMEKGSLDTHLFQSKRLNSYVDTNFKLMNCVKY